MNILSRSIAFASAAALLCSCGKSPDASPTAEATNPAPAAQTIASAPVEPPKLLTLSPSTNNLAPQGTYYLTQRVSITTDSGIFSVDPGTEVQLVKKHEKKWLVKSGDTKFEVTPDQVTNDIVQANAAIALYWQSSRALDASVLQQKALDQGAQREKQKAYDAALANISEQQGLQQQVRAKEAADDDASAQTPEGAALNMENGLLATPAPASASSSQQTSALNQPAYTSYGSTARTATTASGAPAAPNAPTAPTAPKAPAALHAPKPPAPPVAPSITNPYGH